MVTYIHCRTAVKLFFQDGLPAAGRPARNSGEHVLQRAGPCMEGFIHGDDRAAVLKYAAVRHLANDRVWDGKLPCPAFCNFADNVAPSCPEEVPWVHIMFYLHTQLIAECHLAHCLCQAVSFHCIGGNDPAGQDILTQLCVPLHYPGIIRQVVPVPCNPEFHNPAAWFLKLRRNNMPAAVHIHRKGHKGWRHVDLAFFRVKGAGHAVLASNGPKAQAKLRAIGAQKGCKRLAPSGRVGVHPAEIFLEREMDLAAVAACGHNLGDRGHHCIYGSVVRAPAGKVRVKPITHHGHRIRVSLQYGQLCNHGLRLGQLVPASVRHEHGACPDGAVKALHQTLL